MLVIDVLTDLQELSRYEWVDRECMGTNNKITLRNPNGELVMFELDNTDTVFFLKLWGLLVDHRTGYIATEEDL